MNLATIPVTDNRHSATWGGLLALSLVGAALLMSLALSSASNQWLGLITLVPLLWCMRILSPSRACLAGGLYGLSLAVFSGLGSHPSLAMSISSVALITLVVSVYGWLGARITRRIGFSPLILALGWVVVELALKPLAIKHGLLASTQGGGLFVRVIGPVAGYLVVAFLIAYFNASILEILTGACTVDGGGRRLVFSSRPYVAAIQSTFLCCPTDYANIAQPRAPPLAV